MLRRSERPYQFLLMSDPEPMPPQSEEHQKSLPDSLSGLGQRCPVPEEAAGAVSTVRGRAVRADRRAGSALWLFMCAAVAGGRPDPVAVPIDRRRWAGRGSSSPAPRRNRRIGANLRRNGRHCGRAPDGRAHGFCIRRLPEDGH